MTAVTIRELGKANLTACLDLATSRHWLREEKKWRLLFNIGTVYGAEIDGAIVGTLISTAFGPDASAISMMLVAEHLERQGIGTKLMQHALAHARTPGAFLAATTYGRTLYERVGYRTVGEATVFIGRIASSGQRSVTRAATPDDLPAIRALDARATGLDRDALINRLPAFCHQLRVALHDEAIVGYAGTWRNLDHSFIGPVIANNSAVAIGLIEDVAAEEDVPVRLEVPTRHSELIEWVRTRPIEERFTTTLMEFGPIPQGKPEQVFLPIMLALG